LFISVISASSFCGSCSVEASWHSSNQRSVLSCTVTCLPSVQVWAEREAITPRALKVGTTPYGVSPVSCCQELATVLYFVMAGILTAPGRRSGGGSSKTEIMQPRLVVTERVQGIPTMGTCSACPQVTFASSDGPTSDSLQQLQRQFDDHYRTKHDTPGQ
jgi:hypothetical protein